MLFKYSSSQRGFVLLELLSALTILLVLCCFCYTPSKKFLALQYPLQLKIAAQMTAADIRTFQQDILFNASSKDRIVILSSKEGYIIESNNRKNKRYVYFKDIGCEGVYFATCVDNYISYSNTGAPTKPGAYVLKHRKDSTISYTITLQVSSGRVDLNES